MPLIQKLNADSTELIFKRFSDMLYQNATESVRDLAGSGMKIMLETGLNNRAKAIIKLLVPNLVKGSSDKLKDKLQISLDLLNDLLINYGKEMEIYAEQVQTAVMPHMSSKDSMNKKKAINCLGHLSMVSSDEQFKALLDYLLNHVSKEKNVDFIRTDIQCLTTVAKFAGHRMASSVQALFSLFTKYLDDPLYEGEDGYDEELRETLYQMIDSLIKSCPQQMNSLIDNILGSIIKFIKYDPNRAELMDVDDDNMEDGDLEDDDEYDDEYDDEDLSWKVRKAASHCLTTIIKIYPKKINQIYHEVAPKIIERFGEHEENVQIANLTSFLTLVQQNATIGVSSQDGEFIKNLIPSIVTELSKLLYFKKPIVNSCILSFQILRQLSAILPGCFSSHIQILVENCKFSFTLKNINSVLKTEIISFLSILLSTHSAGLFLSNLNTIYTPILSAIKDNHYKISSQGISVCVQFVKTISELNNEEANKFIPNIFNDIQPLFLSNEADKEVKEASINVVALIISLAAPLLQAKKVEMCLSMLTSRLEQELVRVSSIKAITTISESKLQISLNSVISAYSQQLTMLLKQQSRNLRVLSLGALTALVNYDHLNQIELLQKLIKELAPLISASEPHSTFLTLHLAAVILSKSPPIAPLISNTLLDPCFSLLKSSMLQGNMLDSLVDFFATMISSNHTDLSYEKLTSKIIDIAYKSEYQPSSNTSRLFFDSIAKCISKLVVLKNDTHLISQLIKDLNSKKVKVRLTALHCLGEIGRIFDVSSVKGDAKQGILQNLTLEKIELDDSHAALEDIKSASSIALGGIAIGNLTKYLPEIFEQVEKISKFKYLLVGSLREIIVSHSHTVQGSQSLSPFFPSLAKILTTYTSFEEEGVRNIVAECWGKLALSNPENVFKILVEQCKSKSPLSRSTVISSLKYTVAADSSVTALIDSLLETNLDVFLSLLNDPEVSVRHASLLTFNYIVTHRTLIIKPLLHKYIPILYNETKIKPELITVVEIGPFKHNVDHGSVLRQASYECMYTLLDNCLAELDLSIFTQTAMAAFDQETSFDNKSLKLLLLTKLVQRAPSTIISFIDQLIKYLKKIFEVKAPEKEGQSKDNISEHSEDLVRLALRLVYSIQSLEDISNNSRWSSFFQEYVMNNKDIKTKYESISKDNLDN